MLLLDFRQRRVKDFWDESLTDSETMRLTTTSLNFPWKDFQGQSNSCVENILNYIKLFLTLFDLSFTKFKALRDNSHSP